MKDSIFLFPTKLDRYLGLLSNLPEVEDEKLLQEIIVNSTPRIQTGYSYDNYNGDYYGHALHLTLPEPLYIKSLNEKHSLQDQIKDGLNKINDIQDEFIELVIFELEEAEDIDWRTESGRILKRQRKTPENVQKRIWGDKGYRVFLSHKSNVKSETATLKERLGLYGISCFVAHEDIHPSREWQQEIEHALHTMDAFIPLLTEDFSDSDWTDQEIGFAVAKDVPIVPINLGKIPYGFMGKIQALACSWKEAPLEIAKILIKNDAMIDAYINAMARCESFDDSNTLAQLLPSIEKLNPAQVDEMIKAYNGNGQISDSYGFNGRRQYDFGEGLIHHLKRITKLGFDLSWNRIERAAESTPRDTPF